MLVLRYRERLSLTDGEAIVTDRTIHIDARTLRPRRTQAAFVSARRCSARRPRSATRARCRCRTCSGAARWRELTADRETLDAPGRGVARHLGGSPAVIRAVGMPCHRRERDGGRVSLLTRGAQVLELDRREAAQRRAIGPVVAQLRAGARPEQGPATLEVIARGALVEQPNGVCRRRAGLCSDGVSAEVPVGVVAVLVVTGARPASSCSS